VTDTRETAKAPLQARTTPAKPLWRTFLVFLTPMMLANVLQSLSGTINNVFLGHMIGVEALAAATVFFPVMFFFIAFVMGLGAGASILIGQAYGKGDHERVRAIAGATLALSLIFGIIVAIFGGIYADELMHWLQTPADIVDESVKYARIMMVTMPAFFIFILFTSMLRGVGDSVTPLWTLAFSTFIGLIVTPALIEGWFGLPKLGVASAAVASLVSMVFALIWLGWYLLRRKHPLAPSAAFIARIRLDPKCWPRPAPRRAYGIQMVIMAVAELALLGLANGYGSSAAPTARSTRSSPMCSSLPCRSASRIDPGAQAIGGGRAHQLGAITRTALILNAIITGAGVLIVYLLSGPIVAMFITAPEVIELTQYLLHIVLWSTVVFGMAVVFSSMMRSSGTVLAPTAIAIFSIIAVEVPVAVYLSGTIGISGVWWAYPSAFCAMFILQGSFYMLVWRKRSIRALV
jgi:Na+-driven multidrug efflux pump